MSSTGKKQPRIYELRKSTALRPNPVIEYESFMHTAVAALRPSEESSNAPSPEDEAWTRRLLYRELAKTPLRPDIQALIDESSLNPLWVRNHLLAVGTWSERLRQTVRAGLPLRVAALVARIRRHAADGRRKHYKGAGGSQKEGTTSSQSQASELDRIIDDYEHRALMPFYEVMHDGQRAFGWGSYLDATIRQLVDEILVELADESSGRESAGWIEWGIDPKFEGKRKTFRRSPLLPVELPNVMLYDSLSARQSIREALHPLVAHKLVSAYLPFEGGYVIDPMAGTGTIVHAALRLGHHVWAGDIQPQEPFIVANDVLTLEPSPLPRMPLADLLVLHPPTYETWQKRRDGESSPTAYRDFIQQVVNSHGDQVQVQGHVLLIVEPFPDPQGDARGALLTSPPESHPQVIAMHTLASRDGLRVLHVMVFGASSASQPGLEGNEAKPDLAGGKAQLLSMQGADPAGADKAN